jgi:acetoin utilization deacetylase AcuC-like enzyme
MSEESIAQRPTTTTTTTAILADPVYKQHDPGAGHPERPERYDAVTQALTAAGLMNSSARIKPRFATEDEVALCHSHAYIQKVTKEIGAGRTRSRQTPIWPTSDVALEAAGGI